MTIDEAMAYANDGEGLREIEDTCDALDVLQAEVVRLRGIVEKGLDYEHHSSCGHVWTMRHTACPECFAALRQRHVELEVENARLRERINDDRLYLSSCVAHLADMAGTPWHDGLKRMAALEGDHE